MSERGPIVKVPGEPGLWILILGDLCVFLLFFVILARTRYRDTTMYAEGVSHSNLAIGLANTLMLVTSSFAVALALHWSRTGKWRRAVQCYVVAIVLGIGFATLKVAEYAAHILSGFDPAASDYFMYYFVFTGIHLVHVLVGLAGLTVLLYKSHRGEKAPALRDGISVYWHMVDMLWIGLFYLLYLAI